MKLFNKEAQNWIKCGGCNSEFDLNKNKEGCPMCGFGKNSPQSQVASTAKEAPVAKKENSPIHEVCEALSVPATLEALEPGEIVSNEETKTWGSWLMFNDIFSMKFLARVSAWKIKEGKSQYFPLMSLMKDAVPLIKTFGLSELKGFPKEIKEQENLQKNSSMGRLVYHFLCTGINMGLFKAKAADGDAENLWSKKWEEILVTLTQEGLEFAKLSNPIFDSEKILAAVADKEQVLSEEEKNWLVAYLKKIDEQDYKEYSVLKEVYDFLKKGNNGNKDLWNWFESNPAIKEYVLNRSEKAKRNEKIFKKQLHNYARSFAASKVSLLRELGLVKNKRNDYTVIGELK